MIEGEEHRGLDLLGEHVGRRVAEGVHPAPAADLDLAELRVIEGAPALEARTAQLLVVPTQERQLVGFGAAAPEA